MAGWCLRCKPDRPRSRALSSPAAPATLMPISSIWRRGNAGHARRQSRQGQSNCSIRRSNHPSYAIALDGTGPGFTGGLWGRRCRAVRGLRVGKPRFAAGTRPDPDLAQTRAGLAFHLYHFDFGGLVPNASSASHRRLNPSVTSAQWGMAQFTLLSTQGRLAEGFATCVWRGSSTRCRRCSIPWRQAVLLDHGGWPKPVPE